MRQLSIRKAESTLGVFGDPNVVADMLFEKVVPHMDVLQKIFQEQEYSSEEAKKTIDLLANKIKGQL